MKNKFQVIVADPPYSFLDKLKQSDVKRGASDNYSTMSISDIKALKISEISDPDGCLLALWVPSSLLQEGLDTMKAWGFKHKQTYVWIKVKKEPFKFALKDIFKHFKKAKSWSWTVSGTLVKKAIDNLSLQNELSFGMGRIFRNCHEICLIGTNNNKIYKLLENKSQRSVSFGENLKHSAKPEHLQNSLEIMFPRANKIELFSRRHRPGWLCIGNELCMDSSSNPEDIRDSLNKIIYTI